jgi:hypothetical protein
MLEAEKIDHHKGCVLTIKEVSWVIKICHPKLGFNQVILMLQ